MASSGTAKDFETLRNTLAVQAALRGCFAGFQGRLLDVKSAPVQCVLYGVSVIFTASEAVDIRMCSSSQSHSVLQTLTNCLVRSSLP